MFAVNSRAREATADGEARQRLLNDSHEDLSTDEPDQVVFTISDDEDSESNSTEAWSDVQRAQSGVRFQEEVQVIGPPLRSTMQSREAGAYLRTHSLTYLNKIRTEYELDSDDFDDTSLAEIQREQRHLRESRSGSRRERTTPLLVGLMDASAARRTPDTTIPMYEANDLENGGMFQNLDLDELAAKQWSGGGLLNSVANMANSILGAGKHKHP